MMLTEEQARKKWCPMVTADNVPPDEDGKCKPRCIASQCMAWRWGWKWPCEDKRGYCGLVGQVDP